MSNVLAFLQNAYTSSEEHAREIEEMQKHPRFQALRQDGLFDGANYTGLLLKRSLTENVVRAIWWENASPRWGWLSHHKFPADHDHIKKLLSEHTPSIVLTFGKIATVALQELQQDITCACRSWELLSAPHPAARDPKKYEKLRQMRDALITDARWEQCPHCKQWGFDGGSSHCQSCYKPMYEQVNA